MIKSFNPIKSRRPWPPISISHLFQQGPFSSWPLLFLHLGCFCLDINIQELGMVCSLGKLHMLYHQVRDCINLWVIYYPGLQ